MNIPSELPDASFKNGLKHIISVVNSMPENTMFDMKTYSGDVIGQALCDGDIYCSYVPLIMKNIFGWTVQTGFVIDESRFQHFNSSEKEVLKLFTHAYGDNISKSDWLEKANEVYFKQFIHNFVSDFTERTEYFELPELIVSAAQRSPDGLVIMSRRHFDTSFYVVADKIFKEGTKFHDWSEGFYTNKDRYVDRYEAWEIAKAAFQIRRITGHPGRLYSEDIY